MTWRPLWSLGRSLREKQFPDLKRLESEDQRRNAMKTCRRNLYRRHRAVRILSWGLPFSFAVQLWLIYVGAVTVLVGQLLIDVEGILVLLCMIWLYVPRLRYSLREYLNEIGLPTCLACGYDLTGLTEPRCPECGKPFAAGRLHHVKNAQNPA